MAKTRRIFASAIVIVLSIIPIYAAENLLKNGNFSNWKPGAITPAYWYIYNRDTLKPGEFTREKLDSSSNKNTVKFTSASPRHSLVQSVKVKGGEIYELSCLKKVNIGWHFAIAVQWRDKNRKSVGSYDWTYDTGSDTGFETMSLKNIKAPENAETAVIKIYPYACHKKGALVKGTILVTDVSFVRATKTAPEEMPVAEAAIPLLDKAKINVDGKADEPAWKKAVTLSNFTQPGSNMTVREHTDAKVAADAENLYIFVKAFSGNPDALKKVTRAKADKVNFKNDVLEFFFKPDIKSDTQYHILIDPAGSVMDLSEKWRKTPNEHSSFTDSDKSWNSGVDSSVKILNNAWTVELKIPLKNLGVKGSPADGKWLANIARGEYGKKSFSSWSLLPAAVFQKNSDWGRWTFAKGIPAVGTFMLSKDKKNTSLSLSISNLSSSPANIKVQVDALADKCFINLGQKQETVGANATDANLRFKVEKTNDLYWVSVWDGKRLLYRNGLKPYSKYISITYYDPENVIGNSLWLASDLNSSFKAFKLKTNFKNDIGHFISRKKTGADIVVELPPGIEATYYYSIEWGRTKFKPSPSRKEGKSIRNGIEYTIYVFPAPALTTRERSVIFFKTNWKVGRKGKAYIYARWKGGSQPRQEYEIKVLKVGRMKPFKRTPSRWDIMPADFIYTWLDNPVKDLKELGINAIPVPLYPEKQKYFRIGETQNALYEKLIPELKKNSYFLYSQNDTNPAWYRWTYGKDADIASRWLDIDGRPVINQFQRPTICFLYRGKYFQKWLDKIINSTAVKKYGVSWIVFDFELWSEAIEAEGCYNDNCLQIFKEWCPKNGFKNITVSPKVFMKKKPKYPKEVEAWKKFNEWRAYKFYADIRQKLETGFTNCKEWTGPKKGLTISEWCNPRKYLVGTIDYFDVNLYHSPKECYRRLSGFLEKMGDDFHSLSTACAPTQYWLQSAKVPPTDNVYAVFEAAVAKTQGFEWFYYCFFDMLNLKAMLDGYRAIRPFEDVYLDGKVIVSVPCSGRNSSGRAITLNNETLLLVRDYDIKKTEKVTITVPGNSNAEIFDARSKEKLGTVSAKNRTLTIKLDPQRKARLLYIGPAGKFSKRLKPEK